MTTRAEIDAKVQALKVRVKAEHFEQYQLLATERGQVQISVKRVGSAGADTLAVAFKLDGRRISRADLYKQFKE